MTNNSHFPIHSATEMFRLWAGGADMDLIVARKNRKNDWALKLSLHYTLWWCCWETEITKAAAIYIEFLSYIKRKNICCFFLFWNKAEWKSYHQTILTSLHTWMYYQLCFDILSPFCLYSKIKLLFWTDQCNCHTYDL